jgi:hypothetical protein
MTIRVTISFRAPFTLAIMQGDGNNDDNDIGSLCNEDGISQ